MIAGESATVADTTQTTAAHVEDSSPPPDGLTAALAYACAGLHVLPIWPPAPGSTKEAPACSCPLGAACGRNAGKHPLATLAPKGQHDATIDEATIRRWWTARPDANIAISLAPSERVALDVDEYHGDDAKLAALIAQLGDLPATIEQRSGSGQGTHLVYRHPGGAIRGQLGGIVMRGANYIVVAPSIHPSGGRYAWADGLAPGEIEPADLPPAWIAALRPDAPRATVGDDGIPDEEDEPEWLRSVPQDRRVADMRAHLESELGEVHPSHATAATDPRRVRPSMTFNVACTALRRYAVRDPQVVADAMIELYSPRCEPPYADHEIARRVANACARGHTPEWGAAYAPSLAEQILVGAPASAAPIERPTIVLRPDQRAVTDEAERALAALGGVYVRGRTLVHVVRDRSSSDWLTRPDGSPVIEVLPRERLRELLGVAARWIRVEEDDDDATKRVAVAVMVPPWVVDTLLARGEWSLPALEGVVDSPVLRADGTILASPGYDAATRLIYDPRGVDFPSVTVAPTHDDAVRALGELLDPFADFSFVAPSDRAAVAALILSIVGRGAIAGPVPMFPIGAPTPGSGKGLLADLAAIIATGRVAPAMASTDSDDETRKRLLAIAIESPSVVLLDNVEGSLGSPSLAMALTTGEVRDRVLGSTRIVVASLRPVWLATGNQIQYRGDLGRRVIPVDLDPRCEHPEDRDGWQYPDVRAHVRRERPRLVVAALTILRAYVVAGRPAHGGAPKGSYESWDALVRGAVIWSGGADPLAGVERVREQSDTDLDDLRALLAAWFGVYSDREVTTSEVVSAGHPSLRAAIAPYGRRGAPEVDARSLGYALRRLAGRVAGGQRIERGARGAAGTSWKVVAVTSEAV